MDKAIKIGLTPVLFLDTSLLQVALDPHIKDHPKVTISNFLSISPYPKPCNQDTALTNPETNPLSHSSIIAFFKPQPPQPQILLFYQDLPSQLSVMHTNPTSATTQHPIEKIAE